MLARFPGSALAERWQLRRRMERPEARHVEVEWQAWEETKACSQAFHRQAESSASQEAKFMNEFYAFIVQDAPRVLPAVLLPAWYGVMLYMLSGPETTRQD